VSELVLAVYVATTQIPGFDVRRETGAFVVVGVFAFCSWVFLFFGSPFLVSSHRWLAIFGWALAVGAFLLPAL
jgi:hypothetical protein